jgi:uncharacterized membrane protein YtjA (UPF0391 family)
MASAQQVQGVFAIQSTVLLRVPTAAVSPQPTRQNIAKASTRQATVLLGAALVAGRRKSKVKRGETMLGWAITFLIIALIAGVLGFGGVMGTAAWIAKILLFVFLILAIASFLMGRRVPVS